MKLESYRQSETWFEYLKILGWKYEETKSGIKIALLKSPLGVVTKIQRPKKFTENDLQEIENICKKYKALFIKIEPIDAENETILKQHGFVQSQHPLCPPSTSIINLKETEKELWNKISHSGKYSINRSTREGSVVKFLKKPSEKQTSDFYKLVVETSKRGRFYIDPLKEVLYKAKIYGDDFHVGYVENGAGELMSVKFFLAYKKSITFITGGTAAKARKGKWGYALLWESILYFKKLGFEYMDLEGVDDSRFPTFTRNWGGFSHFKEKFGGEIVRFPPPYIKFLNPAFIFLSKIMPVPL